MSYLLTQIFLYMFATFALGLLLGWLLWSKSKSGSAKDHEALLFERDDLSKKLDACRAQYAKDHGELNVLRDTKPAK